MNNKRSIVELAREMDRACSSATEMSEEELVEYDAEYGYDYYEEDEMVQISPIIWTQTMII